MPQREEKSRPCLNSSVFSCIKIISLREANCCRLRRASHSIQTPFLAELDKKPLARNISRFSGSVLHVVDEQPRLFLFRCAQSPCSVNFLKLLQSFECGLRAFVSSHSGICFLLRPFRTIIHLLSLVFQIKIPANRNDEQRSGKASYGDKYVMLFFQIHVECLSCNVRRESKVHVVRSMTSIGFAFRASSCGKVHVPRRRVESRMSGPFLKYALFALAAFQPGGLRNFAPLLVCFFSVFRSCMIRPFSIHHASFKVCSTAFGEKKASLFSRRWEKGLPRVARHAPEAASEGMDAFGA